MIVLREMLMFAADFVLTLVWLKASLLVLALVFLRAVVSRRSASLRSAISTLAVAALLLLPVLPALLPSADLTVIAFPRFLFQLDMLKLAQWVGAPVIAGDTPVMAGAATLPLALWLGAVWMAGAVLLIARFARQVLVVRLVVRTAEAAPDGVLLGRFRRASAAFAPRANVRLACSEAVTGPITFGWRHAVVLLPRAAREWSTECLDAVLAHELAHVARRDYLVLVLAELVRALYWLNPLVSRLTAEVRAALECACDDAALRTGVSPEAYAKHLLELARWQRVAPVAGGLPMVRQSFFRARMQAILDEAADRTPASRHLLLASAILWVALVSSVSAAGLWSCTAEEGVPNSPAAVTTGPSALCVETCARTG